MFFPSDAAEEGARRNLPVVGHDILQRRVLLPMQGTNAYPFALKFSTQQRVFHDTILPRSLIFEEPLKNAVPISEKRDAIENRERAIPT
jgi:hypothetical protein